MLNEEFTKLRMQRGESIENIANILNLSVDEYNDKEKGHVCLTNHEKTILREHYRLI
ncbi:hypothetical protein CLTEP_03200 [Clostridium tepidiprofundi DSM 19306]|uniref:HTH cro/C1-type domain-containing protein n=1 Tax=Clostridium tepidiprofundi DSM 19306 TaxID=1121338 RepID=A0A151B8F5_9CLOT|nr:hypothetical protein [Clostridium tepidiprofundi]KYH35927.1 hypothetical protein CLTEP_03200 [Clostridium tepidiprofundi DSM 19306]